MVPVACLSVLVTGRRAGGYRIGLTLGLTQVGLHQAFMLLAQPHCVLASSPPAGTGHAAMHIASCAPAMAMPGPPPVMVAAHVAAAAATGLLLGQGERLLWSILGWLGPRRPTASGAAPLPVTHWAPHHDVRRPARRTVQTGGLGRRGPPVMHAT